LRRKARKIWPALRQAALLLDELKTEKTSYVQIVDEYEKILDGNLPRTVERFSAGWAASRQSAADFAMQLAKRYQKELLS
jgi:hypothetical protein